MPTYKSEQFFSDVSRGKISGVYLFDGPEKWLKERAIKKIIDTVLTDESRDLNLDRFHGSDCRASDVVNAFQSMPFLSEKRVVIVQESEELTSGDNHIIGEALSVLPQSTVLVFVYDGKAGLREAIPAQVSSIGTVVTFWTPFANQLPSWIVSEVRQRGKSISFGAAHTLAESCRDLQEISSELDKLFLFIGKKNQIDVEDIRNHGLPDGRGDFKGLEEAIWSRSLAEGLHQAQLLGEMGIRAEAIFPVFEKIFRNLILARYLLERKGWNRTDVYAELGLRGKTRQGQLDQGLRQYSLEEVLSAFKKIVKAHLELKTGALQSDLAVSLLTLNIFKKKDKKARISALC
ncbi:DNA polymerase III subunit delta [bacterium F11]|nr:DNA polymerase III subunit delta [bacterium F11]